MRSIFLGNTPIVLSTGFGKTGDRQFRLWDVRKLEKPLSSHMLDAGAGSMTPYFVEDNGVVVMTAKGELTVRIFEIEGISMAHEKPEIGRTKRELNMYEVHRCAEFRAVGEPAQAGWFCFCLIFFFFK